MQDKVKPWNERYSGSEFYYGIEPNDFLKAQAARITPQGRVLCLAEGEGRNAVFLAKLGLQVTAVDQSSTGLKKLSILAKQSSVSIETVVADLNDYKIVEDHWDAIVSIWCHVPPSLRVQLHADVIKGLKPGAAFILESYHPRQLGFKTGGPSDPELMVTRLNLKDELKGLRFDILHEIDREVHEGKGHFGMSAVTQCLAFR